MFGYVFPKKSELRIREFAEYRAVYCALCEALRSYGFGAKAFLNYDFTFAAMLFISLSGEKPFFCERRCNTNPFKKVGCIEENEALRYSAAALIITSRYKLYDDLSDENLFRKIAAAVIIFFTKGAYNKAKLNCPEFDSFISERMGEQAALEKDNCDSIDRASDPTAKGLSFFFLNGVTDEKLREPLKRFGYLLGRFVYFADALDDLEGDIKKKRYNPFILKYKLTKSTSDAEFKAAKDNIRAQLRLCEAEAEKPYDVLPLTVYKPILDNIVYLGLIHTAEKTAKERKKEKKA